MVAAVPDEGYRGGIIITIPMAMTMAALFAISIYNVIEINIQIFFTFRKRTGLYFWSLIFASWGIVAHSVGFLLQYFNLCPNDYVNITIISLGATSMIIGQAMVLYSRLHLVIEDKRKIRWVLRMIIASFFLFNVPPQALNFGSNSAHPQRFLLPFQICEKISIFGFSAQESILSGLYLWETRKMLRIMTPNRNLGETPRRIMKHLIYVNILVILLDMTIIGTELGGAHEIQTTYKSAAYSIKLKLEFPILNQLRDLVKRGGCTCDCLTPHISSLEARSVPAYEPILAGDSSTNNTPFPSTHQRSVSRGPDLA